ncbi:hypothetical protein G9A89_007599 [Geosiphon pyriformis]|nr:hypothetical protein G9A89_007599 [Geosiphon pyriformis]
MGFDSRAALLNSDISTGSLNSKEKIVVSDLSSVMVADGILLVSSVAVFEFVGADKLPETASDKWVGTAIDKRRVLRTNKLVVDRLAVVL